MRLQKSHITKTQNDLPELKYCKYSGQFFLETKEINKIGKYVFVIKEKESRKAPIFKACCIMERKRR